MQAPVTRLLLFTNIAIHVGLFFFAYFVASNPMLIGEIYRTYGLVPVDFWDGFAPWQPLTSMFLHGGLLHIMVNMIALWSLGTPIEKTIGSNRFTWLYFISGFTGAAFVVIFQADLVTPTIGASGAITGILGALAIFYPNSQLLVFFFPMKARTAAILFGLVSLGFALFGDSNTNLSHLGHLGGLIGGLLYSKFALNLNIGRSKLDEQATSSPFSFSARSGRQAPGRSSTAEDEILRIMEQLQQQRMRQSGSEKEINPVNTDQEYERNSSIDSDGSTEPQQKGKLVFDPETGRFFFK